MRKHRIILFFVFTSMVIACMTTMPVEYQPAYQIAIHDVPQILPDLSGDVDKGWDYIYYGGYVGSGYPATLAFEGQELDSLDQDPDFVKRRLGYGYNTFEDKNGVQVLSSNCFTCHAGQVDVDVVYGLGNAQNDFTKKPSWTFSLASMVMKRKLGRRSDEFQSFSDIWRYQKEVAPRIVTDFVGPNPAFRLEESCVAYRDPVDLTYRKQPNFPIKDPTPASDVPPLWNVAKKKALYYNGMGRGSFAKLLMQAAVLGVKDSTHAREIVQDFQDVVAWAATIKPPVYPAAINRELVPRGKAIFEETCSKCHGTYGDNPDYPNKIIPLEKVGTDPYYAQYFYSESGLTSWYNSSWFAHSQPSSQMLPSLGYVAPPLDGIWATAPYLHNGSVPTLMDLLDSDRRPDFWKRGKGDLNYDYEQLGLTYTKSDYRDKSKETYRTDHLGFDNSGHTFGDHLTDEERKALLEYLKTL